MGGNLLKNWGLPDKRLPTQQYQEIEQALREKFRKATIHYAPTSASTVSIRTVPFVRNKTDHGDIDIWFGVDIDEVEHFRCTDGRMCKTFGEYIEAEFGHKPVKNSNVYSFPYDGFQVDVNLVLPHQVKMCIDYSAWGDLGNIMGRVYHKMGLHYGHDGLQFWIRQGMFDKNIAWSDSDHIYKKYKLTTHTASIFEFGGFNVDRWAQGFDTEEDVFRFVADSKYFDPTSFQLENLNHANRTRNRKRGMYMRFIQYINENLSLCPAKQSPPTREEVALYYQLTNPEFRQIVAHYRTQYEVDKIVKSKINGHLIKEWTGITDGPTIGKIVSDVKDILPNQKIVLMPRDEIKSIVMDRIQKL